MQISRRGFLGSLAALVAAPAIVPVENLMKLPPRLILPPNFLTIDMITREAVRMFRNSNTFIRNIDLQYNEQFESSSQIGAKLRIRMLEEWGEVPAGAWEALQSPHSQVKTWT